MSAPESESYPGSELSLAQLAYALDRKLNAESTSYATIRAQYNPQQLVELKASIRRLLPVVGVLQNAFSSINRLHPETIAHIIEFLPYECYLMPPIKWKVPYGWIAVIHVCSYWRYTALAFPRIWSDVHTSRPKMALKCLELSKATQLDIRVLGACPVELLESIQTNLGRTRQFDIDSAWSEVSAMLSLFIDTPIPKLEALRLSLSGHTQPFPLAFRSPMPCLNHLTLSGTALTEPIPKITNLTVLHLKNENDICFTSMTNLLDVLESNKELWFLEIKRAGPRTDDASPERIVHLDNIVCLTLETCAVKIILGHLALPPTTGLTILNTAEFGGKGPLQDFLPPVVKHLGNLHNIKKLGFGSRGNDKCSINGSVAEDGDQEQGGINIVGKAHRDEPNGAFILKSFRALRLGPLSFENVTELWLRGLKFISVEHSGEVLGSMPKLKTLFLLGCNTVVFLRALTPSPNKKTFPCPNLRNLTIFVDQDHQSMNSLAILYCAETRRNRDVPLEHVSFISYHAQFVDWVQVTFLKEMVTFVEYKADDVSPTWPFDSEWDESDSEDSDDD